MKVIVLAAILVVAAACGPLFGATTEEPPPIIGDPLAQPTETQVAIAAFAEVTATTKRQLASLDASLPRERDYVKARELTGIALQYDKEIEAVWAIYTDFLELVVKNRHDLDTMRNEALTRIQTSVVDRLNTITAPAANGHASID